MKPEHMSVVQVFVEAAYFNWAEPFKAPEEVPAFASAFFIDAAGHLITSFHVVSQASSIEIQLPSLGKERFDAHVVGVCPEHDLALLKLDDESLGKAKAKLGGEIPFLPLGDSDKVIRGQEIMALGYPLGQDALKSTQGVVSGRQSILGESFLQITAALNPGNSGGPSIDKEGTVIGINTAMIPEAQSIGYIIPISDVKGIIEDMHRIELLRRPLLGCELNYATDDLLTYLGNPQPGGLYVARVYKNTLFDRAGVKEGDMLYQINEYMIDMYGEVQVTWSDSRVFFTTVLNRFKIGQPVELIIYRQGKKQVMHFNFDLVNVLPVRVIFPEFEEIDIEIFGGIVAMPLTLNHVMQYVEVNPFLLEYRKREKQEEPRLLISSVLAHSQASKTRTLFPGDIIAEVNGDQVTTLDQLRSAIKKSKEFLTVKTESKKFVVLSYKKVLEEQEELVGLNNNQ